MKKKEEKIVANFSLGSTIKNSSFILLSRVSQKKRRKKKKTKEEKRSVLGK